jgi:hypothetical protein
MRKKLKSGEYGNLGTWDVRKLENREIEKQENWGCFFIDRSLAT